MIARKIVAVAFFAVLGVALFATPSTAWSAYGVYVAAAPYYPGYGPPYYPGYGPPYYQIEQPLFCKLAG